MNASKTPGKAQRAFAFAKTTLARLREKPLSNILIEELEQYQREKLACFCETGLGRKYARRIIEQLDSKQVSLAYASRKELKSLISSYPEGFAPPSDQLPLLFLKMVKKCHTPEWVREWNTTLKSLIKNYRLFGEPTCYALVILPELIEKAKMPEDLQKWNREIAQMVGFYHSKFGNPSNYIYAALPEMLKSCKTIKDLRKAKSLARAYAEEHGNPHDYVFLELPKILETKKS